MQKRVVFLWWKRRKDLENEFSDFEKIFCKNRIKMLKIWQIYDNIYVVEREGGVSPGWKVSLTEKQILHCFAEERKVFMFDFVEQPVAIRDYEYSMLRKHSAPVVVQGGIQPVALFQEDVRGVDRPQSLLGSVFSFRRSKG